MYKLNEDRIFPDYLKFDNPIKVDSIARSDYSNYTNFMIMEIDQQETYFLKNTQQMLF